MFILLKGLHETLPKEGRKGMIKYSHQGMGKFKERQMKKIREKKAYRKMYHLSYQSNLRLKVKSLLQNRNQLNTGLAKISEVEKYRIVPSQQKEKAGTARTSIWMMSLP
jgi:hypothetical protein